MDDFQKWIDEERKKAVEAKDFSEWDDIVKILKTEGYSVRCTEYGVVISLTKEGLKKQWDKEKKAMGWDGRNT